VVSSQQNGILSVSMAMPFELQRVVRVTSFDEERRHNRRL
jgi:hypothetical protein